MGHLYHGELLNNQMVNCKHRVFPGRVLGSFSPSRSAFCLKSGLWKHGPDHRDKNDDIWLRVKTGHPWSVEICIILNIYIYYIYNIYTYICVCFFIVFFYIITVSVLMARVTPMAQAKYRWSRASWKKCARIRRWIPRVKKGPKRLIGIG